MKGIILFVLNFTFVLSLFGQNTPQRSAINPENWGVVFDVPATKNVRVSRDVPYLGCLGFVFYSPPVLNGG